MKLFPRIIEPYHREVMKQRNYEFGLPYSSKSFPSPVEHTRKSRWWLKWMNEQTLRQCRQPYSQRVIDEAWLRYMETDT